MLGRFVMLFILFVACAAGGVFADEVSPPAPSEEEQWQTLERRHHEEIRTVEEEIAKRRAEVENKLTELRSEIQGDEERLAALRSKIAERAGLAARLSTVRYFGVSGYVAFVVLIVHLLVYLYRAPEPPLPFGPAAIAAAVILLLFSLPAFAAEMLDESLADTNLLLGATPAEKALYWVAHLEGAGTIPRGVTVRDRLLTPYRDLVRGSAEYEFTRAALLYDTGSRESAIDALREIPKARLQGTSGDALYSRAIQFLARERTDALDEVTRVLIPKIDGNVELVRVAASLEAAGHNDLLDLAVERILGRTRSSADLVEPADQAYALGASRTATRLATVGVERIRAAGEALALAGVLFKDERDAELARKAVSGGVAKAKALDDFGSVIQFCLGRRELQLTTRAAETAIEHFGKRVGDLLIEDPRLIYPDEVLPGPNQISVAVLLGILNEKLDIPAGAKPAYGYAAELELGRILDVGAFSLPANLRSLFYIQRFWRKQRDEERLRLLRPIYEKLQEQEVAPLVAKIRANGEEGLKRLIAELPALERKRESARHDVENAASLLRRTTRLALLWVPHMVGIVTAVGGILWGCIRQARTRAGQLSEPPSLPVAIISFVEAIGWVLVLSVVGVWMGLPLLLISGLMQANHVADGRVHITDQQMGH